MTNAARTADDRRRGPRKAPDPAKQSFSVRELATYWRTSPRKVRDLIRRRLLRGFDLGKGRQQIRITPAAIAECEHRLAVGAPATQRRRRADGISPTVAALLDED
jgi:Helix-turn-helix domain